MAKIQKTSPEVKSAIQRKSAYSLPNNPTESGYKANDIRNAFYKPIIDATNSALTEIDRLVDELNGVLEHSSNDVDFISTVSGVYYHGSDGLIYTFANNEFTVSGYEGTKAKNISIPSSVFYQDEYYPVVAIGDEAFKDSVITGVEIPSSVASIGDRGFAGCSGLHKVKLLGDTEIGSLVFIAGSIDFSVPKEYLSKYQTSLASYKRSLVGFDTIIHNANDIVVLYNDKLNKVVSADENQRVYGIGTTGAQITKKLVQTPTEGEIPIYLTEGRIKVGTPTEGNDSTNKNYVDTKFNNAGSYIDFTIDTTTYIMTLQLKNNVGTVLSSKQVDLPLESVVVNGEYDNNNKIITLTLQNNSKINIPVGDLVLGLSNTEIEQDLTAVGFTPVANKYYKHIGTTTENFKQGVIYFYNGEEYKAIDGSGSGGGGAQNIVDGEGLYSVTINEDTTPEQGYPKGRQNEMHGRAGLGAGHKNKLYQADGIIGGNGNKMGLTEDQFNHYWWDSDHNVPLNGGQGKDSLGRILDAYGSYYAKSYINSIMAGEGGELKFRDSINVGYNCKNENVATQTFGEGTIARREGQMSIGMYNKNDENEDNLFEIGNGTSNDNRKNAFSVNRYGVSKIGAGLKVPYIELTELAGSPSKKIVIGDKEYTFNASKGGEIAMKEDVPTQTVTAAALQNTIPLRQSNGSFKVGKYLVNGATYRILTPLPYVEGLKVGAGTYGLKFSCEVSGTTQNYSFIYLRAKDATNITEVDYGESAAIRGGYVTNEGYRTITITEEPNYNNLGIIFLQWFEENTEIVSYPDILYSEYDAVPKKYVDTHIGGTKLYRHTVIWYDSTQITEGGEKHQRIVLVNYSSKSTQYTVSEITNGVFYIDSKASMLRIGEAMPLALKQFDNVLTSVVCYDNGNLSLEFIENIAYVDIVEEM